HHALHHARSAGGGPDLRLHRRHALRTDRGVRSYRRRVPQPAASLHARASCGRARERPGTCGRGRARRRGLRMKNLPADPLDAITLEEFGRRLRSGRMTCESATRAYVERIGLLASGTDLGPLMGVPVAIKDLFTVDGMPRPRCGSDVDISDLVPPEGEFVRRLKRAGCVILGKTRMTEFAFGLVNVAHPTPWNPVDSQVHRMPGGSSGGSAAALAAGMCAFSIGSDTGGSVRHPAAMCALFGYKATSGMWPTDG